MYKIWYRRLSIYNDEPLGEEWLHNIINVENALKIIENLQLKNNIAAEVIAEDNSVICTVNKEGVVSYV